MNKEKKINIYLDTIDICKNNEYQSSNGEIVYITNTEEMINGTQFYQKMVELNHNELLKHETVIKVIDSDTLYAAKDLVDQGYNPCVLNMASFHTPGGGVLRGSSAQEENIFRRTNLFLSLYQFHEIGKTYDVPQREERYPLNYNFGAIYTPNVTVFKESDDKNYALMNTPFKVGVVSVAAVKNPQLTDNSTLPKQVVDATKNKIKQMLNIALINGHDSIVLSAFGCGAYKNPPTEVAKIFKEILSLNEYKNAFKIVEFAIINLKSTNGEHNPQGNFQPFYEILNQN